MDNQENQEIKNRGRGRPKKTEEELQVMTPEIRKEYNSKFYDIHKKEKRMCKECNKEISIFNMSHHISTSKHLKNKEILDLKSKIIGHEYIEQLVA